MIRESLELEVKKTRMRTPAYVLALLFAAALSGCAPTKEVTTTNVTTNSGSTKSTLDHGPVAPPITSSSAAPGLPVATSHGQAAAPAAPATQGDAKVDTSAYDARIKQAEKKAKTTAATEADKRAAAAAYLERANLYYTAQQPSLYKFALGDFRTVLKYDPSNEEARAKMEQIVSIYQSMGRPVPTNGLEQ
jgi:hypothetical protein